MLTAFYLSVLSKFTCNVYQNDELDVIKCIVVYNILLTLYNQ